jgi:hypothetical protein
MIKVKMQILVLNFKMKINNRREVQDNLMISLIEKDTIHIVMIQEVIRD